MQHRWALVPSRCFGSIPALAHAAYSLVGADGVDAMA
jgi:hypothetical protein